LHNVEGFVGPEFSGNKGIESRLSLGCSWGCGGPKSNILKKLHLILGLESTL
jgi:hypothetical protein